MAEQVRWGDSDGEITEPKIDDAIERENELRQQVASPGEPFTRKDNAKFGWLGRDDIEY